MLEAVACEITRFDTTLWKLWSEQGLTAKLESYGLRYVTPLYELLLNERKQGVVEALVVQLLSCVAWRHFDNCVDLHEPLLKAHVASLLSYVHLYEYSQRLGEQDVRGALEEHYRQMAAQAALERTQAIELTDIWRRCSIFLFAAESIAQLSNEKTALYKCYINYTGLAHDAHDLLSDTADKVWSLPARWMKEVNPEGVLSIAAVKALYDRVRIEAEPLEEAFKAFGAVKRLPLLQHLWNESWKTLHDE
jgi:hypothetical protein